MSFKHLMLSSAAALAILSGTANAVDLQNDGTGDYLLFPNTYAKADGSWKTNLKIVNTNTTHAIVARVVVRNSIDSEEIFDFPLYLTPGDVWEGTLQAGESKTGKLVIKTSDDSAMLWAGSAGHIVRANVDGPLELTSQPEDSDFDGVNRNNVTGGRETTYVEVFGLAAYDGHDIDATWTVGTPLDKVKFFEYCRNVTEGVPFVQPTTTGGPLNDLYGIAYDVDNESLLGKQVIVSEAGKLNMAHNAVALGDVSTGSAMMDEVITTLTTLQNMSNIAADVLAPELFALLSKDKIYVMNEGAADATDASGANPMRVIFTDPVKKYLAEAGLGYLEYYYLGSGKIEQHYYEYYHHARDMMENPRSCNVEGNNTDISGNEFSEDSCVPTPVYHEVQEINYYSGNEQIDYIFPSGGYVTFEMDENTSIVPTSFSSSVLNGSYVNYHIDNQYKTGIVSNPDN